MKTDSNTKKTANAGSPGRSAGSSLCDCLVVDPCGCLADPCICVKTDSRGCYMDCDCVENTVQPQRKHNYWPTSMLKSPTGKILKLYSKLIK